MRHLATVAALVTITATAAPSDSIVELDNPSVVVVQHCQVFPLDDVEVSAAEAARILTIGVKAGDQVQEGQLVAQLDDRQARIRKLAAELERDAALARAEDDIEIRYAIAAYQVADAELVQNLEINRRSPGTVPDAEIRRLRLIKHRAELQVGRSRLDQKIARMNADVHQVAVEAAEDEIQRRQIVAPFDGMVVEVFRQRSDWVSVSEATVRVTRIDRLRVDGFLDAKQVNPEDISDQVVEIEVERAHGEKASFIGRVVFVSPLLQAGARYRVRAEVENKRVDGHWILRPGMTATMSIDLR
jgi:multidrug efflux pump subunit AcrA (membrane-fusion protein)